MSTPTTGSSRRSRKREPAENHHINGEMPDWAQDLEGLWSNEEPNLEAEIRYNTKVSSIAPYCAICSLFAEAPDKKTDTKCAKKPKFSKPLISDKMFSSNAGRLSSAGFTPAIDVEGRSPLVTCVNCAVCVHASCYGLQYDDDYSLWKCSKCAQKQNTASCSLCHLRGGALKRTTTGRWCHIVCALAVPEVAFESVVHRSPISVTRVPSGRMKMKCEFCYGWTGASGASGATGVCIQCCDGVCTTAFHVSCAQAFGIKFSPAEWPFPVDVICHKHDGKENSKKKPTKGNESFPVAKLSPRKSVSAGPRSSSYSPVRQLRRSGSATNIPDIDEGKDESLDELTSGNASPHITSGNVPAEKSRRAVVCLKFLSDTEVKRLSSPSSSPMARAKVEEEPSPKLSETKSPKTGRKLGPLSKTQGQKRQASGERSQSQTLVSESGLSQEPTLTPCTPGSLSPAKSVTGSPKVNSKLSKAAKNCVISPEKPHRRRLSKDTNVANLSNQENKVAAAARSDGSHESVEIRSSDVNGVASKKDQPGAAAKKDQTKKSPCVKDKFKSKKTVQSEAAASKKTENAQSSKLLDTANNKSISKKSPLSPKCEKTVGSSTGENQTQAGKRMVSPKRPKKVSPNKTPSASPNNSSPKSSPLKSTSISDSSNPVKSSSKSNPVSPVKSSPKSNCGKYGSGKSSAKKASPSKADSVKSLGRSMCAAAPSPSVVKKILCDTADMKKQSIVPMTSTPVGGSVVSHSNTCKLLTISISSPATSTIVSDSRLMPMPAENALVPLPATQPLACSTPLQDISDCAKDQQSPVTSRSRSGRAIKISSVAREAFMDSTEENNFGFLMGHQSGEVSPDPVNSKSFTDEVNKDASVPAKKLHWKTLQKMDRLRLQQGDGADVPPLYVPKLNVPKVPKTPHNSEHIQAVIDMVVENARRSVDEENGDIPDKTSGAKNTSLSDVVSKQATPGSTSTSKPERSLRSSPGKPINDLVAMENGFVASASSTSVHSPSFSCVNDGKSGLNEKLTDLIAKMATRVKEVPPEEVPPSSSSAETTPNKSVISTSSQNAHEESSGSEEESSDSEDDCTSISSPEKSVCSRSRSPRFLPEDAASTSTQDMDWYKGEVQFDGMEDDNNNEAASKLEENVEELESSRDSFDYINSISNAGNVDSAEEHEGNAEPALTKVEENNRILSSTENPNNDGSKNAFFSAELESYLLNVSPVKQGELLNSKGSANSKIEFKKGPNNGWKNSMDPDIDEVEGVMFFSFSCKEALEMHVKKEKSSVGKPRQVCSSLAKYHAKIQQDAAVSGMGLYPRGSCKSLVKHLTFTQLDTLGLDLPRQACRYPDFSRENEWRQVNRGAFETAEESVLDAEDSLPINELTSQGASSFDVNVTRIYGRKSDGTFARKKMALPRLKRLGPAQPVNNDKPEPPGLDKYESQSKEWGIVTSQIIQQRARELKQEGFTFPRKKPLVSYQPVTLTSSMALAAAAALKLVPTTPREPADTECKRLGCRYGCVCHLCESVPVEDEDEGAQSDDNSTKSHSCPKQYCRLGCICDSIDENASSPRTPTHCGKSSCMFECVCKEEGEAIEEWKTEKDEEDWEPGEVRIPQQSVVKEEKTATADSPDTSKEVPRPKVPTASTRGRGRGGRRGMGRGRGATRSPHIPDSSTTDTAGGDDPAVRKSSRLKNKPLIGIGNIDRLNSLVFFDTVAWLADGDGPRKRRKTKDSEGHTVADSQGTESSKKVSSGSRVQERIGSNSSNHTEMEDGDAFEEEGSDDAMEEDDNGPATCARAYVYVPKKRRRLSQKSASSEVKDEGSGSMSATDSPEPRSIKIKTETMSPVAKTLSPASRQFPDSTGDYIHPLMGKFKTQMVLLQRKRTEQTILETLNKDTPYLLEIQSNCDWEGIRSQLLSKISTEMNLISANAQYEYPDLTSFKIGPFIADILPRPEKATTIPPNLQRILGTKDMYPIRIRIIHTSCQLNKREENVSVSPVTKQIDAQEKSLSSPTPEIAPAKSCGKESPRVSGIVKKKEPDAKKKETDSTKADKGNNSSSFVGLSGLSRLNLKIDGYPGTSVPSMSFLNSVLKTSDSTVLKLPIASLPVKRPSVDHAPRHPKRTPTPPGMQDAASADKTQEKANEATVPFPCGQVMFIPITANNSGSAQILILPQNEGSDVSLSNSALSCTATVAGLSGTSLKLKPAVMQPSAITGNVALPFLAGPNDDNSSIQNSTANCEKTSESSSSIISSLLEHNSKSGTDSVKPSPQAPAGESGLQDADSCEKPGGSDSNTENKSSDCDKSKVTTAPDTVKYVPAGFLVVPGPAATTAGQGSVSLSVKAIVVGPQNIVASTHLPAGTNIKALPRSFRLTPVVNKMDIPVKYMEGKMLANKVVPASTDVVAEKSGQQKCLKEKTPSPPAKVCGSSVPPAVSDSAPKDSTPESGDYTKSKESDESPETVSARSTSVTSPPELHKTTGNRSKGASAGNKSAGASSCKSANSAGVPITINCSIQSGSVKYTEGTGDTLCFGNRLITSDASPDSPPDKSLDSEDYDHLYVEDEESDSIDVETGDGESMLLALRMQQTQRSKNRPERRSSTPNDRDQKKRNSSSRELSTHSSRLDLSATTTEKKALPLCVRRLEWLDPRERKRRYQMCKLFTRMQKVYEKMCNVVISTGVPVPKYRLLQFAIRTIGVLEDNEKKLADSRSKEARKRLHLMKQIRELQKEVVTPIKVPPSIPTHIGPFQHETWFDIRKKNEDKESDDGDLSDDDKSATGNDDNQPSAFHFRPIEEVVPDKPGHTANTSKGAQGKKSKRKSPCQSEKGPMKFPKNSPKIANKDRVNNKAPQVYIDYDDGCLYNELTDAELADKEDRSQLNRNSCAETTPANHGANSNSADKSVDEMTNMSTFTFRGKFSEHESVNDISDLVSDQKQVVRKRKLSRCDGTSPSAKESKL